MNSPIAHLRVETIVPETKQVFALTDVGNAERFAAQHREHVRYCFARRKWLVWDGSLWRWDDGPAVYQLAKQTVRSILADAANTTSDDERRALGKHALASESHARITALLKLAQGEPGIAIELDALDADPWLLHCRNGTLELRTGQLRAHRREDLITKSTNLDFDSGARSELWESFFQRASGGDDDLVSVLRRMAGYACTGVATERAFWLLFGSAGTGKSAMLDALQGALGDYAVATSSETFLAHTSVGGNRGDIVRLAGTRLVVGAELRKGAKWDEALIKQITGGDTLTAAAKFEGEVSFRASCTIILAANDAPTAREDDPSFWARCRRVPFDQVIPEAEQVRDLKDRLRDPEHARAVLAWAVQGCLEWQSNGLGTCAAVERSTAEYRAESDRFGEFLEDQCVLEEGCRVSRTALRDAYEKWAREVGLRTLLGPKQIVARLRREKVTETTIAGTRTWVGIRLREA